jgi:hypothetical protein
MIPYGRQHIDEDDIAAVASALRGDYRRQARWSINSKPRSPPASARSTRSSARTARRRCISRRWRWG